MTEISAVVLAGGRNDAAMQAVTGVENRALTTLGNKTMLDYVIDALRGTAAIGEIFVVGNVPEDERYQRLTGGKTLLDNMLAGLEAAGTEKPVLVSTSDIPFVNAAGIEDFIARAQAAEADLCYPIVPMDIYRQRFPRIKRTTLRLREGNFTGGNIMLVHPRVVLANKDTMMRAYAARKSPWQLGRMLGWGLLGKVILAQMISPDVLTIPALEAGVARLLGGNCRAAAIITHYPEIGMDVDKPGDVMAARENLAARTPTPPLF